MKYKVISFDVFQTLADVNERIPDIWQGILKEEYTKDKAVKGAKAILKSYPDVYEKAVIGDKFLTMEEIYFECAARAMDMVDFDASSQDVAYNLMYQHSKAPFYAEVLECIKKLHQQYQIILSSDSSHLMVDELICNVDYDTAFISDDIRSYKGDKKGGFFNFVLSHLDVEPKQILHIGDSVADILGANKAGIDTCWINRDDRKWINDIVPNYIIKDLYDLMNIL